MSWKLERDALIAQTMAFVQSVTGRKQEAGPPKTGVVPQVPPAELPGPPALDVVAVPKIATPTEPERAVEQSPAGAPTPALRTVVASELADEIRARVAGFRAHQERFNREREEYFSQTLARLQAETNEMPPPPAEK